MITEQNAESFRNAMLKFRTDSYRVNPELGRRVDILLNKPAQAQHLRVVGEEDESMGDATDSSATDTSSLQDMLNSLVNGFNSAASSIIGGTGAFYNAQTQIKQMQAAAAAGMTLDQYQQYLTQLQAAQQASAIQSLNPNVGGIPTWLVIAGIGIAVVLVLKK